MSVLIENVRKNSPAYKAGIKAGMTLVSVNGCEIRDVLDWQFYGDDDMGLEFGTFLMDKKRGCKNNCVFCFINQLPKGLRPALYFKDDDSRLSFLQGNYITLTNLSDGDIARIIKMRTPVNVSVHTTNPALRSYMTGNKNGGESLKNFFRLANAGITMNCQIVVCPGINDGEELMRTLCGVAPLDSVESVACVPVGLTKFRDNLPRLRLFTKDEAREIVAVTELERYKNVFAADEFYLTAGLPVPDYEYYGSFPQYENGVGMWAYLKHGFYKAAKRAKGSKNAKPRNTDGEKVSIVTGTAAYPLIKELAGDFADVYAVANEFFGESVTVSGLLTGGDIIRRLKGEKLGRLLIGANMLNADGVFLDGVTPGQMSEELSVEVIPVENDGQALFDAARPALL